MFTVLFTILLTLSISDMKISLLVFLTLVSLGSPQSQCLPNYMYVHYNGSCYFFNNVELEWFHADQICSGLHPDYYDVHLAAIETQGEQEFIANILRSDPGKIIQNVGVIKL